MNKISLARFALCLAALLTACGEAAPSPTSSPTLLPSATVTSTPDPCAPDNIAAEIKAVHRLMREFDDEVAIAGYTEREQLQALIIELQRIRREAEDQPAPACLESLKELQLAYMNTLIQAMLAFMGGIEQDIVGQGIGLSRQLHNQYMLEMARLQGVTAVAAIPASPTLAAETPVGADTASALTPMPDVPIATNAGPTSVYMRARPALDAQVLGTLQVGQSALVLGLSPDGFWVMIEIPEQPGQVAWVYVSLVQLHEAGALPVIPLQ